MKKNVFLMSVIFIFEILITWFINDKYENKIFFHSILVSFILILIVGIIFTITLFQLYQVKVNHHLKQIKDEEIEPNRVFEKWSNVLVVIYSLLIIIPVGLSIYKEKAPSYIYTVDDFEKIKENPDGHYILMNDLDFSQKPKDNKFYTWCSESYFNGTLDGNGKTIENVNETLFFCTLGESLIKDLTLDNVNISGPYAKYTGTISNIGFGTIENVHVKGKVTGFDQTGGLIGSSDMIVIKNSSYEGEISGLNQVGGILGRAPRAEIKFTYTHININGNKQVGGLVGEGGWIIVESYSVGMIEGDNQVGGLAGLFQGKISNSYADVTIIGNNQMGGLVGLSITNMENSFSLGNIQGNKLIGGIIGDERGSKLLNSFVYGDVSGITTDRMVSDFEDEVATIDNCFAYEGQKINDELLLGDHLVTQDNLMDSNWYTQVLKFDEEIWDLSKVGQGYFPKLKNIKNQEYIKMK